jgi:putative transposase
MRTGRPKAQLTLSEQEQLQLQSYARSRSLPAALSTRADIILSCAQGQANNSIAERLKLSEHTVGKVAGALYRAAHRRPVRRCANRQAAHYRR